MGAADISPFSIHVDDAILYDPWNRLEATRFPEAETVDEWNRGLPLEYAPRR